MTYLRRTFTLALITVACNGCGDSTATSDKPSPPTPAIGADGISLYGDEKLGEERTKLAAGTELTIISAKEGVLEVKAKSGEQGWVRRCSVCSTAEFQRRKTANQIPTKIICLGSKDGRTVIYGGRVSIRNGQVAIVPGDALWMDHTMEGEEFTFASIKVIGDPSVLLLTPKDGEIIPLHIWPATSDTK